jgi:Zn-dependent M28 family amino/carboxypeptidase
MNEFSNEEFVFKHQSGAYDDASGVSVILELIVNLMNRPPLRHSVLFVCYTKD